MRPSLFYHLRFPCPCIALPATLMTGILSADDLDDLLAPSGADVKLVELSKEKVDNMVKAKAEHVGILREVEILLEEPASLSTVQKGRLANLHTTAQTALELLKQVAP